MKAAIVNPYLDTLGGGERYTMAVAMALSKVGYKVDVEWGDEAIRGKLEDRFGIKLQGINFVKDVCRGDGYEVCFWVSDGSIPTLRARKNLLHFQVPFKGVHGKNLMNKMKLFRVTKVICNSEFTKKVVDREYGFSEKSIVIYPPVDVLKFRPRKKKENIILYVGRFSTLKQSKRQDILIKVFRKMNLIDWKLVLAGGVEVGADVYLRKLKRIAKGKNVQIIESPDFEDLRDLYAQAKIFWSASGYGVDEEREPMKVEHLGITPIEAMSAGVVPLIFAAGGHKETVQNGVNGFLWKKKSGLLSKTRSLINDPKLRNRIARAAKAESKKYSYERFEKEIIDLL